jgi:hypothetical protein
MTGPSLERYAERELKYQARKTISKHIRKHCPAGDPMTTEIITTLGAILTMALFTAMLTGNDRGRTR